MNTESVAMDSCALPQKAAGAQAPATGSMLARQAMKPLVPRAPDRVERNTPSSLRAFRMRNLQLTRANTQFCEMTDLDFTAAASEDSQEVHEAEPLRDVPSLQALLQTREGRLTKRHAAALRWAKGEALDRLGAAYATCDIFTEDHTASANLMKDAQFSQQRLQSILETA
ncbi:unnamed protein product [Symbiodinium microadriaticum]|nr:unnamed protein product [Symbiodinium sp. KB8]CAE7838617.1 unnamed protein product [Symbiodinium microadriaticum]